MLWVLQEKLGATYDEAVYISATWFRINPASGDPYKWFGIPNDNTVNLVDEYLSQKYSISKIKKYMGSFREYYCIYTTNTDPWF